MCDCLGRKNSFLLFQKSLGVGAAPRRGSVWDHHMLLSANPSSVTLGKRSAPLALSPSPSVRTVHHYQCRHCLGPNVSRNHAMVHGPSARQIHVSPVPASQPLAYNSHTVCSCAVMPFLPQTPRDGNCCSPLIDSFRQHQSWRHPKDGTRAGAPGDGSRPVLFIQGHCHLPEVLSRCGGSIDPQAKLQSQCVCALHIQNSANTHSCFWGQVPIWKAGLFSPFWECVLSR